MISVIYYGSLTSKWSQNLEGHEFGYYVFDQLPDVNTNEKKVANEEYDNNVIGEAMQAQDTAFHMGRGNEEFQEISNILNQLQNKKLQSGNPYFNRDNALTGYVKDSKQMLETIAIPQIFTILGLRLAHDKLWHNGSIRMYIMMKRFYYWKDLKPSDIFMSNNEVLVNKGTDIL